LLNRILKEVNVVCLIYSAPHEHYLVAWTSGKDKNNSWTTESGFTSISSGVRSGIHCEDFEEKFKEEDR